MIDGILNKKLKGKKWFFYTKLTNAELDSSFLTLETTVDKNNLQLKVHLPPLVYFMLCLSCLIYSFVGGLFTVQVWKKEALQLFSAETVQLLIICAIYEASKI